MNVGVLLVGILIGMLAGVPLGYVWSAASRGVDDWRGSAAATRRLRRAIPWHIGRVIRFGLVAGALITAAVIGLTKNGGTP